jgi:succinyl-diaminopimelate desuccinylase
MMQDRELAQMAKDWIEAHREEMVRDLIRMVNIESVAQDGEGGYAFGSDCAKCADAAMEMGRRQGLLTENDGYYCVSLLLPGESEKELGILGHLDVVTPGDGWNFAPFDARYIDGYVIGRGASDNKGPCVLALYLLRFFKEKGIHFEHTLRLIYGFNEEDGFNDVKHYVKTHELPRFTLNIDGCWAMIYAEKSFLEAELAHELPDGNLVECSGGSNTSIVPGNAWAVLSPPLSAEQTAKLEEDPRLRAERTDLGTRVTATGEATHAMMPENGVNAIYVLMDALLKHDLLEKSAKDMALGFQKAFADNYGTGLGVDFDDVRGGKDLLAANLVRTEGGKIIFTIAACFLVERDYEAFVDTLEKNAAGYGFTTKIVEHDPGRSDSLDDPVISMLLDTCHEFLEERHEAFVLSSSTHSRHFPRSLPYGPGVMGVKRKYGNPHGPDEALWVQGLLDAMPVYAVALKRMDDYFTAQDNKTAAR